MASVIRRFEINKLFKQTEFDARIFDYTNDDIVQVSGNIETNNTVTILNIYFGKKSEYVKNKTIEIRIDENGNFEELIQLVDGNGKYYITAELSTAGGSTDFETLEVVYETNSPLISELTIQNFDERKKHNVSEDYYIFYSEEKTYIDTYFTSVNNDPSNQYYYKLWLSYDLEPENSIPLSSDRSNVRVDISNVRNGEYYITLKVIDSAGNTSIKNRRININKTSPIYDIENLQIANERHYVSLNNDIPGNIKLLINSIGGSYIESGKIRMYKDNKIISYKNENEEIKIDNLINQYVKISGLFFLPDIDVKETWNLSEGEYEIEIFYLDIFGQQKLSNRIPIYVKNSSPVLSSYNLSLDNPASLIFSNDTIIPFSISEVFFNNEKKQITCFRINEDGTKSTVTTTNSDWIYNSFNREYETNLTMFFNNDDINMLNNLYTYNVYEFHIENDFGDPAVFTTPMIYKPKENLLVLSQNFLFPSSEYPTNGYGLNSLIDTNSLGEQWTEYLSSINNSDDEGRPILEVSTCNFLMSEIKEFIEIGFEILYEVDFQAFSSFKTSGDTLYYKTDDNVNEVNINDPSDIKVLVRLKEVDSLTNSVVTPINSFISFYFSEDKSISSVSKTFTYSYQTIFDEDYSFQKVFTGNQNQLSFFVELNESLVLESNDISIDKKNGRFSSLRYINSVNFSREEWYREIITPVGVSHSNDLFEPMEEEFTFKVYRDIREYLNSFEHHTLVHDDKFDLRIQFPFSNGIEDELLLFVDVEERFNTESFMEVIELNSSEWSPVAYDADSLVLKDIRLPIEKLNGSFYLTVYYKFKNSDQVNSFVYFLQTDNTILDLTFEFGNNNIISTKKSSTLVIKNNTEGAYYIKQLRIFAENSLIYTLDLTSSFNSLNIDVNNYDQNGNEIPGVLYFDTEDIRSIIIEGDYDLVDYSQPLTNYRTFISDIHSLSIIEESTFSNVSMFEIPQVYDDETLRNQKFEFIADNYSTNPSYSVQLEYFKTKEIINDSIVDVINPTIYTSTIFFKTYYNAFTLGSFNIPDYEDGLYSIKLTVNDLVSNLSDAFYFELECFSNSYSIDIKSLSFFNNNIFLNERTHELEYEISGGLTENKYTNVNLTLTNKETGEIKNIIGPSGEFGNSVLLEFTEGHNELKMVSENRFGYSYSEHIYNIFYYSETSVVEIKPIDEDNENYYTSGDYTSYSKLGRIEYISTIENNTPSKFLFDVENEDNNNVFIYLNGDTENNINIDTLSVGDHYELDLSMSGLETFGFMITDESDNETLGRSFVLRDYYNLIDVVSNLCIVNELKFDVENYDYVDIFMDTVITAPLEFKSVKTAILLKKDKF